MGTSEVCRNIPAFILLAAYGFFLTACSDNSIIYDENSKSITAKNAKSINNLRILENDSIEFYLMKKEEVGNVKSFELKKINKFYTVYVGYPRNKIDSFLFRHNSTYLISNETNGDAGRGKIKVSIDSAGTVAFIRE